MNIHTNIRQIEVVPLTLLANKAGTKNEKGTTCALLTPFNKLRTIKNKLRTIQPRIFEKIKKVIKHQANKVNTSYHQTLNKIKHLENKPKRVSNQEKLLLHRSELSKVSLEKTLHKLF